MSIHIVTLTGPSCAGKTTLASVLTDRHGFREAISTTTRAKRSGEVEGQAYYFVGDERFNALAREGAFVEQVQFGGARYGITRTEIERVGANGTPVVLVVEPGGRAEISRYCERAGWRHRAVFVDAPADQIAARFLARVLQRQQARPHASDITRLAAMLEQEPAWRAEVHALDSPYDMLIQSAFPEDLRRCAGAIHRDLVPSMPFAHDLA